jgi:NAD(P)-dependent dehydrogenase (short-subunit alcohol dehydrogenase family)
MEAMAVIVAASSQGIGKAVARGLDREEVRLALCARTESVLLRTAEEIRRETGTELIARVVDVTVPEQVHWFVGETARHFWTPRHLRSQCRRTAFQVQAREYATSCLVSASYLAPSVRLRSVTDSGSAKT